MLSRFGVARVDQPLRRQLVLAFGHRALRGEHEAFDALLAGIGLGEVDETHAAGRHRAHAVAEFDARPLLHLLAAVGILGEVDAGDRADAPLRVGQAARIAVHDGVIGHAAGERIVFRFVFGLRASALLGFVVAPSGLLALASRRAGAGADGVSRDLAAAHALGEALELVGRLVDRLQMALVLELAPGRCDVGVPALGHATARELNIALVEWRLQLQQEHVLLDVKDGCRHDA